MLVPERVTYNKPANSVVIGYIVSLINYNTTKLVY